jgi:hypothetical protein
MTRLRVVAASTCRAAATSGLRARFEGVGLSRAIRATILATTALLLAPAVATAARVEVIEGPGPRSATLLFVGGEASETVTATVASETEEAFTARIEDAGAPLEVGPGCSDGGAPGTAALCGIHKPRLEVPDCGGHCLDPAYKSEMRFELGGGDDVLEAGHVDELGPYVIAIFGNGEPTEVFGGPGDDSIATGPARDVIEPGPGNDVVHAGAGVDTVLAGPGPDGDDLLDLGPGYNIATYAERGEPIDLAGNIAGATGEEDRLIHATRVVGGSAGDHLVASPETRELRGGPGDDELIGSDSYNNLYGGPGADRLYGRGGRDHLSGGSGDDLLSGGGGDDRLVDLRGRDTMLGGGGLNYARLRPWDTVRDCQKIEYVPKVKAR